MRDAMRRFRSGARAASRAGAAGSRAWPGASRGNASSSQTRRLRSASERRLAPRPESRGPPRGGRTLARAGRGRAETTTGTLVKICGVTTPEDATMAGEKGADFIGFIMSDGYKRSVDLDAARAIVTAISERGAEPVGIFTRETAEEITAACDAIGLRTVQLHGDAPRENLKLLPPSLKVFYVVHSEDGKIATPLPAELAQIDLSVPDPAYWKKPIDWVSAGRRNVDYILVDKKEAGGQGKVDWDAFPVVPKVSPHPPPCPSLVQQTDSNSLLRARARCGLFDRAAAGRGGSWRAV